MSDLSHIYAKLHENRFEHVIRARRERELQAENYRLRKVLEPFVSAADNFDSFAVKNAEEWFAYSGQSSLKENGKGAITVGDLRRAREALNGQSDT